MSSPSLFTALPAAGALPAAQGGLVPGPLADRGGSPDGVDAGFAQLLDAQGDSLASAQDDEGGKARRSFNAPAAAPAPEADAMREGTDPRNADAATERPHDTEPMPSDTATEGPALDNGVVGGSNQAMALAAPIFLAPPISIDPAPPEGPVEAGALPTLPITPPVPIDPAPPEGPIEAGALPTRPMTPPVPIDPAPSEGPVEAGALPTRPMTPPVPIDPAPSEGALDVDAPPTRPMAPPVPIDPAPPGGALDVDAPPTRSMTRPAPIDPAPPGGPIEAGALPTRPMTPPVPIDPGPSEGPIEAPGGVTRSDPPAEGTAARAPTDDVGVEVQAQADGSLDVGSAEFGEEPAPTGDLDHDRDVDAKRDARVSPANASDRWANGEAAGSDRLGQPGGPSVAMGSAAVAGSVVAQDRDGRDAGPRGVSRTATAMDAVPSAAGQSTTPPAGPTAPAPTTAPPAGRAVPPDGEPVVAMPAGRPVEVAHPSLDRRVENQPRVGPSDLGPGAAQVTSSEAAGATARRMLAAALRAGGDGRHDVARAHELLMPADDAAARPIDAARHPLLAQRLTALLDTATGGGGQGDSSPQPDGRPPAGAAAALLAGLRRAGVGTKGASRGLERSSGGAAVPSPLPVAPVPGPTVGPPPGPLGASFSLPGQGFLGAGPMAGAETEPPQQIVRAIRLQWTQGVSEARVRLQPRHLGEVLISLRVEHGVVRADLQADSAEVRHLIRGQEAELRRTLDEQGLHLASLTVTEESERRQDQQEQAGGGRGRRRSPQHRGGPRFEVQV